MSHVCKIMLATVLLDVILLMNPNAVISLHRLLTKKWDECSKKFNVKCRRYVWLKPVNHCSVLRSKNYVVDCDFQDQKWILFFWKYNFGSFVVYWKLKLINLSCIKVTIVLPAWRVPSSDFTTSRIFPGYLGVLLLSVGGFMMVSLSMLSYK